ncbi:MAG: DUF4062 domain-containing protein [Acidobacteriota bacterium]|nr:DUF4062 domain-containing protein [Acidobacteriota bacterium]
MGKHRVFLSSTFTDLAGYRQTVQNAIKRLGAIDVSMEYFGARDEKPMDECIRLVKKESDIFVGIYAYRYGYIPEGENISISEMEYKAASEANLPRFIFIIDKNQPWLPEYIDEGENRQKLKSFKEILMKKHICETFGNPDELATKVVAALGRHMTAINLPKVSATVDVPDIGIESLRGEVIETPNEWNQRRNSIYEENRNVFLTHFIKPSAKPDQEFDIYIYLIRHPDPKFPADLSDIRFAEFFMGKYWANKVFPAVGQEGFIGISTSAYGTFLCVCRVTFDDGYEIYIHRYIDFETHRTAG